MIYPTVLYRTGLITFENILFRVRLTNTKGVTNTRFKPGKQTTTTIRPYVRQTCEMCQSDQIENELKHNTYYDKYKSKLEDMAKSSPQEYHRKLENISQEKQEKIKQHKVDLSTPPSSSSSKTPGGALSWPPKELNDILRLELINDKSSAEIEQIWVEHFVKKDCVFAVLKEPHVQFDAFLKKSKECPSFIYPLPKQDGYEFYLSEFKGTEVYFTPLIHYQKHGENSPPCVSLAHFTDFKQSKGIVLMAGIYDDQILSKKEALNLVRQMSQYYGNRSPENYLHVKLFNHQPEQFDYSKLISQYKMMQTIVESELPV